MTAKAYTLDLSRDRRAFRIKLDVVHKGAIYTFATVNPALLPFGLFYSHIFAIVAIVFIAKWSRNALLLLLALFALAFGYTLLLVSFRDVHIVDYFVGLMVLYASLIFSIYVYLYVASRLTDYRRLMVNLIAIQFGLAAVAVVLLFLGLGEGLWATHGRYETPRLQMFFYEPSIYALVGAPLVIYAATEYLARQSWNNVAMLLFAFIPIMMSKSLGVLGSIIIALLMANSWRVLKSLKSFRSWLLVGTSVGVIVAFASTLIIRSVSVLGGEDLSGTFRVVYSLQAAFEVIQTQGFWLGIGPGQLKYVIGEFTSQFPGVGYVQSLANSVASTLATVGVLGLTLKLALFTGIFFATKAQRFAYSRTLFLFVFLYQFTGGYFNNLNEYVLLALAYGYAQSQLRLRKIYRVAELR